MKELIGELTASAFLSLLAESLLPEGSFQKYARMVCGILMMLVFLNALTGGYDFLTFSWNAVPATLDLEAAEAEREANLKVEYRRRLEAEIGEICEMKVHVDLGENLEIKSITTEGELPQEKKNLLAERYQINPSEVRGVTP